MDENIIEQFVWKLTGHLIANLDHTNMQSESLTHSMARRNNYSISYIENIWNRKDFCQNEYAK